MSTLVENVKNSIIGTIKGTGEIVDAVTETESGSLASGISERPRPRPSFAWAAATSIYILSGTAASDWTGA